jgi:hypothetical protein
MRRFKSAKQAQRFLSADRAHRWAFPVLDPQHTIRFFSVRSITAQILSK